MRTLPTCGETCVGADHLHPVRVRGEGSRAAGQQPDGKRGAPSEKNSACQGVGCRKTGRPEA